MIPSINDILFAAGFYEGEGYCRRRVGSRSQLLAQITQKDPEILIRLHRVFGGRIYYCPKSGKNGAHLLTMAGSQAENFLELVYPHLSGRRREQIRLSGVCIGGN